MQQLQKFMRRYISLPELIISGIKNIRKNYYKSQNEINLYALIKIIMY